MDAAPAASGRGAVPLVHHPLMHQGEQLDHLGVGDVLIDLISVVAQAVRLHLRQPHLRHLVRVGHPGLKPGEVEAHHQEQEDERPRHRCSPLPLVEHPEGFVQQHLGGEVANQPPHQNGDHQRRLAPAQEQGGGIAEHRPHAGRHAVFEHRAHDLHRNHVPRALHVPGAVEKEGARRQH